METESPGVHCLQGGVVIYSGIDMNNDGQLNDDEIIDTQYVCNGSGDSSISLISISEEPAGGHCGDVAGKRIDSGLDTNRNGTLDPEEITSTAYVCNGRGEGINAMVNVSEEPIGGECGDVGGIRVDTGLDTNRNGQLDPSEITSTRYVCNGATGNPGADGADGLSSLTFVQPEPAGANCYYGGQAISVGLDVNRDGILQSSEIEQTTYICNGAPGANGINALVRQEDETSGVNCTFGGRRILSGMDENGDGYLDNSEITSVGYACNGAPGAPGHSTIFTTTTEPSGVNCAAGGYRIQSGLDTNDNGILDASEITQNHYVCHGSNGTDGTNSLVKVTDIAAGSTCGPVAGNLIEVGLDTNRNGVLDASEVTQSRAVCNGENGTDGAVSLVTTSVEAAGTHCTLGGTRIDSGLDVNNNGILDTSEITQTSYVCSSDNTTLINTTNAMWGGVCPMGGLKVETGFDANSNGVLDTDEVLRTQYVCNLYFVQMSTAGDYTTTGSSCGLVSDGTVRCWGYNNYGQLGNNTTTTYYTPQKVIGLSDVIQISGGSYHFCALKSDQTVWCWGRNNFGQLGDGSTATRYIPVVIDGLSGVSQVDCGGYHTCALLEAGTIRCWGYNVYGQLGNNTTTTRYSPVAVEGLAGQTAVQIAAGMHFTCAVFSDARARCWGYNGYGQLGCGDTTNRLTPVTVSLLTTVTQISTGLYHTCATLEDNTAACWGYNGYGQLGDNSTSQRNSPVVVNGLTNTQMIACGYYSTCAVLMDGTGQCWGYN